MLPTNTTALVELVKTDLVNLPQVLEAYEAIANEAEKDIAIKGKTIEKSNVEQPSLFAYYDQKRVELKTIRDYIELLTEKQHGKSWMKLTENHSRELAARDKENYIKFDEKHIVYKELHLSAKHTHDQFESIVDAIRSRGYALNNITRLKCAEIDDVYL